MNRCWLRRRRMDRCRLSHGGGSRCGGWRGCLRLGGGNDITERGPFRHALRPSPIRGQQPPRGQMRRGVFKRVRSVLLAVSVYRNLHEARVLRREDLRQWALQSRKHSLSERPIPVIWVDWHFALKMSKKRELHAFLGGYCVNTGICRKYWNGPKSAAFTVSVSCYQSGEAWTFRATRFLLLAIAIEC